MKTRMNSGHEQALVDVMREKHSRAGIDGNMLQHSDKARHIAVAVLVKIFPKG